MIPTAASLCAGRHSNGEINYKLSLVMLQEFPQNLIHSFRRLTFANNHTYNNCVRIDHIIKDIRIKNKIFVLPNQNKLLPSPFLHYFGHNLLMWLAFSCKIILMYSLKRSLHQIFINRIKKIIFASSHSF